MLLVHSVSKILVRCVALLAFGGAALMVQGNRNPTLQERLLAAHNRERATQGLKPLRWDAGLARSAAQWGSYLAWLGDLEHYPDNPGDPDPQGENLWLGTRGHFTPEQMVGRWIAEKRHFKQGLFPSNSKTGKLEDVGHYTQLMWRTTDRVGCAITHSREYDFLVCRYLEGGNVIGERPF